MTSAITKPVGVLFWTVAALCAFGATDTGNDLARVAVTATGQAVGIVTGNAPQIGESIKEGQNISRGGAEAPTR